MQTECHCIRKSSGQIKLKCLILEGRRQELGTPRNRANSKVPGLSCGSKVFVDRTLEVREGCEVQRWPNGHGLEVASFGHHLNIWQSVIDWSLAAVQLWFRVCIPSTTSAGLQATLGFSSLCKSLYGGPQGQISFNTTKHLTKWNV